MALTAPVEGGGPEECVLLEVNSGPRQCKTEAAMQVRGLRNVDFLLKNVDFPLKNNDGFLLKMMEFVSHKCVSQLGMISAGPGEDTDGSAC